jgi:hypothetical protein
MRERAASLTPIPMTQPDLGEASISQKSVKIVLLDENEQKFYP